MEYEAKQAHDIFETGVLVSKSKNMKPNQLISFTLVALCLKVIDELFFLAASVILNAK